MIELLGDMFTSTAPALGHGVNCHGLMGAGVAKRVAQLWPLMYTDYRALCAHGALVPGSVWPYVLDDGRVVFNMATQDLPGKNARLEWVQDSAVATAIEMNALKIDRVAIPRIGCGIGGLSWADVSTVLSDVERQFDIIFEVWVL